jgi:hypothetical protein
MARMGIDDQIKTAFQDLIAPALHELRGQIEVLRADIRRVRERLAALEARRA